MTDLQTAPPVAFDNDLLEKLSRQSALQQMWLSGYLYGIARSGQATSDVADLIAAPAAAVATPTGVVSKISISILYGSQTGNSKKVAGQTANHLKAAGFEVKVHDLNDYPVKQLKSEQIALFVISTQGEGEPPVSAESFYQWLNSARAPRLESLQFSVCGLGDKSYLKFCQTGKDIDTRLEALGARRLTNRVDCDVDFEDTVESWLSSVTAALPTPGAAGITAIDASVHHSKPAVSTVNAPVYDRKHPFQAPVLAKVQLNGRGSTKETWHLELSLEGSGITYEPGDALAVYAQNPPSLVREVLYAAALNGDKKLIFNEKEDSFKNILTREVELSVLNREVLEKYAQWSNNPKLKSILEDTGTLKQFLWGRNVADLFREFPAAMSEATLLGFLRKMPPRSYSIASALEEYPDEVHLTVGAVRYDFNGRPHLGAASTFLADRIELGDTVPVFVERNEYFKLPDNPEADIIMVGPGTGVAPFRAFVQARAQHGGSGKNWLFFGNPHFETDFLYQTEWLNYLKSGLLDRLDVAFSRDQAEKIYVQHRLFERSKLIYERLEHGAYFYVCGDKERMAADVQQAVVQIIGKESGKGDDYGIEYLKSLKKQRRFLEDVY